MFCFSPCTIGCVYHFTVACSTCHSWNYCIKKNVIVTSSSSLEDAARKWFCFAFCRLTHQYRVWSCLSQSEVFTRGSFCMLHCSHLEIGLGRVSTVFAHLCYFVKLTVFLTCTYQCENLPFLCCNYLVIRQLECYANSSMVVIFFACCM